VFGESGKFNPQFQHGLEGHAELAGRRHTKAGDQEA